MSKFNLMHYIPDTRLHGLYGYMEVIESVEWGLKELGHEVDYSVNKYNQTAINIIFGAHLLPIDVLKQLPENTIAYNFEQMRGLEKNQIKPEVQFIADHFQIWEYSSFNLDTWKLFGVNNIKFVPVGYAPILTRISKPKVQDIDVLIYGTPGDKRLNAFSNLSMACLKTVFVCGLYGEARDELIARSKIVLNVNLYDFAQIFEFTRVSYLLANRKAVVASLDSNTAMDNDLFDAIKITTLEKIVDDCRRLLENDDERVRLENVGYEIFCNRDIKEILGRSLA